MHLNMKLAQTLKKKVSSIFPQAVVHNNTPVPIYIIIDGSKKDHHSSAHSIVQLPPNSNTEDHGIDDPEAIISYFHLRRDAQGSIWAPRFTPVIKTPAGSIVHVHDASGTIASYSDQSAGIMGSLARLVRIRPSIKDTNSFSYGRFVSPIIDSPLYKAYKTLAQTVKKEEPL